MITLVDTLKFLEKIDNSITEVTTNWRYGYSFWGKRGSAASRNYLVAEVFYHMLGGEKSAMKLMSTGSHWWVEDKRGRIYELPPNNMGEEVSRDKAVQDLKIRFKKPSWRAEQVIKKLLENIG